MTRIIVASLLVAALASPTLAFDPQPEPPSQQNQITTAQPQTQAKAPKSDSSLDKGRTLADYNIQKE